MLPMKGCSSTNAVRALASKRSIRFSSAGDIGSLLAKLGTTEVISNSFHEYGHLVHDLLSFYCRVTA